MARTLPWRRHDTLPGGPRDWAALGLLATSAVLLRLAARLAREQAPPRREFGVHRVDGVTVGAVYEDGRLVGVLPDVDRL